MKKPREEVKMDRHKVKQKLCGKGGEQEMEGILERRSL